MNKEIFIDRYGSEAIAAGNEFNVLPLLIMCQAILESGWGESDLARNANNFFGIKKGVGWEGPTYQKETAEFSEVLGHHTVIAEFRKYDTPGDCFRDLGAFYHRDRYHGVPGEKDLFLAVQAAWLSGYATDPNYPAKILSIANANAELLEGFELSEKVVTMAAGHAGFGVTSGKRGPDGKFEWNFNNPVVLAAIAHLHDTFGNVRVVRVDDPTGRTDVPLGTRVKRSDAAGAHLHVDVHHNALGTTWRPDGIGIETFRMQGLSATSAAARAQAEIHRRIVSAMGLRDRGMKTANFQVLRETKAPAVLTEGGFMDSRVDRRAMDDPIKLQAQGVAIAEGVAAYLKLPRRARPTAPVQPTPVSRSSYRVRLSWANINSQIGAFESLDGAKALANVRAAEGYKVFGPDGRLVYTPPVLPVAPPAPKPPKKELDDLPDVLILLHSHDDFQTVKKLHQRTGWPVMVRTALKDKKVARKIVAVGGSAAGLSKFADEIELVSGPTWEATVAAVAEYAKGK